MKIANETSINTFIAQRQYQSNGTLCTGFSSLINQNDNKLDTPKEEDTSKDINSQLQFLQNQAYLNKAAMGITV